MILKTRRPIHTQALYQQAAQDARSSLFLEWINFL